MEESQMSRTKRAQTQNILHSSTHLRHHNQFEDQNLKNIQQRINQYIEIRYKQKTTTDSNFILSCLRNHFIFYNLTDNQLENVKQKMFFSVIRMEENNRRKDNYQIYDQKVVGTCFFIVQKGELQILQNQKFKKNLKMGDGFGQIALLYNTRRKQTVRAKQDCQLWVIDRKTFREAVEEVIVKQYTENRKNLQGIRFFMNLTNQQKDLISSALITQKFYKNQTLVQEGDPGSAMYYIKEGTASVYKGSKFLRKLTKGDSFGEQSLYYNTMRQLTVKADQQLTCLILGRDTLNRIMGDKVYEVTFKNFIRWAFQKNTILSKLSKQHTDKIIQSMKISSFKMNQLIFRKGVTGFQKLVVVIEGGLKKLKNGTLVAGKCACYGEQFLPQQNQDRQLDDEIIMSTNGVIAQIPDTAFYQALGGQSYTKVIQNIENGKKKNIKGFTNQLVKQFQEIKVQNLQVIDELANGQFGKLFLVKDKKGKQFVAKTLNKFQIQQSLVQAFIVDQAKVMTIVSFPFVVKCGKIIQSQYHLVYLTQYIKGQQLYQVLKKLGLLSTSDAQFYTAIIIQILQYFQNIQVISRDIKPQNFLVDEEGYLKLINLSTAKKLKTDANGKISRTFTIIGTPHYMAPDIVLGKGYTNLVDLWSLGVCLYEFLCGTLPFGDSSQGPYQIYEEIMQKDLKFPQFINDKKAKKLIQQLLSHSPEQRHGGSFQNLRNHQWFDKFPWDSLQEKKKTSIVPPYIPKESLSRKQNQNLVNRYNLKKLHEVLKQQDKIAQKLHEQKNHGNRIQHSSDVWRGFGPYI